MAKLSRYALGWNQMSETQKKFTTSAFDNDNLGIFHYVVERCEGDDPYTGVSGGTKTAKVIIDICERYLRQQMVPPTIAGSLRWNEMRICEDLKLGEKGGGLPINERIEIGNRTIQKLTQLVGALENSRQVEEVA
ncbi:hypothetical protein N9J96_09310 [Paracoccaceae bacterium]|nr:hypothetical protein [Paracoccaceae bacterium]